MTTLASLALQIAVSQLGQCEQPTSSNRGPMVDKYLQSVKLGGGYPWCQAFVHWCFQQAAKQMKASNPVICTGGVLDCWNRAKARKVLKSQAANLPGLLKPGDQLIMDYGKGSGHTGIIERIEGLTIYTIEGNSNNAGSRNGEKVVRQVRKITDRLVKGFISY